MALSFNRTDWPRLAPWLECDKQLVKKFVMTNKKNYQQEMDIVLDNLNGLPVNKSYIFVKRFDLNLGKLYPRNIFKGNFNAFWPTFFSSFYY